MSKRIVYNDKHKLPARSATTTQKIALITCHLVRPLFPSSETGNMLCSACMVAHGYCKWRDCPPETLLHCNTRKGLRGRDRRDISTVLAYT